tara:strand:+ start:246 stop:434 length:189 start_codon:yes stop_codon:yes gene_type:complete
MSITNVRPHLLVEMSYLVKHKSNPDGVDLDTLNKMSDAEIIDAFKKWKEVNNVDKCREPSEV